MRRIKLKYRELLGKCILYLSFQYFEIGLKTEFTCILIHNMCDHMYAKDNQFRIKFGKTPKILD